MKVLVTIRQTQTATLDIGDIPMNLIRDLLVQNDGTFDGNWAVGDAAKGNEKWTTDDVSVEEVAKAGK